MKEKSSTFGIRGLLLTVAAGGLLIVSGCATPTAMSSSVRYDGPVCRERLTKALQVGKAGEGRPDGGASRIGIGLITFIPFVPYGPQRFTPERYFKNAAMMDYDFRDDLAQTIVKDLTAAGVAQSVGYDPFGSGRMANDDMPRLELTLKEGIWHRNFTTYGCSVMGVYLWLVGLPVSYGDAEMAFEAVVRAPDGSELGRRTFEAKQPLTESAYVPHKFPKQLPFLYQQISPQFRSFVCDCLKSAPPEKLTAPISKNKTSDSAPGDGITERLKKLKELRDAGILTEEEYQTKRKKLVDAM